MQKINGKIFVIIIFWISVIGLLVYSRFINLGWGLPYPMHPDERNMTDAIQQLKCQLPKLRFDFPASLSGQWPSIFNWLKVGAFDWKNCFNPHFFAYGQFPLYFGYIVVIFIKALEQKLNLPVSFTEAAIGLRIISATASIVTIFILAKIVSHSLKLKNFESTILTVLIASLSPFLIQFAHFGTTESLLMMFYLEIVYFSLLFIDKKIDLLNFVTKSAIFSGLAMATKVSAAIFMVVPFSVLLFDSNPLVKKKSVSKSRTGVFFYIYRFVSRVVDFFILGWVAVIILIIFSPHNLINFNDFISSINYESDVALGHVMVFYTRQFQDTLPVIFQLIKVFPYTLGWPVFIFALAGFFGVLSWTDRKINLLRVAFLVYFIPSAIIFAKWSRFMAPVLPLLLIFALLTVFNIKNQLLKLNFKNQRLYAFICNFIFYIIILALVIPGLSYLSIYSNSDVRQQASDWIYKNIPGNSNILSETANVVDIPISDGTAQESKNYNINSFNFYDLDTDPNLQTQLKEQLANADYIFVPSRRIFANYTCYEFNDDKLQLANDMSISKNKCQTLEQQYPLLNKYYSDLFSGKLGFKKVVEFNSYPQINFHFSNFNFHWEFPDEQSEETWTVFDHPVIRIYRRA